jgi:hypothetical protein
MKKVVIFLLILTSFLLSCEKREKEDLSPQGQDDVSFSLLLVWKDTSISLRQRLYFYDFEITSTYDICGLSDEDVVYTVAENCNSNNGIWRGNNALYFTNVLVLGKSARSHTRSIEFFGHFRMLGTQGKNNFSIVFSPEKIHASSYKEIKSGENIDTTWIDCLDF